MYSDQQDQQNLPISSEAIFNSPGQNSVMNMVMNSDVMRNIDLLATLMSEGTVATPAHLRGKKADCFAICLQAMQWNMNPFPVMQKTHLVNGVLGYEAQLVNAVVVSSGVLKGRFSYQKVGPWNQVLGKFLVKESVKEGKKSFYRVPNWKPQDEEGCGVIITATLATGVVETIELMLTQARTRNSTLWADDPYQQLCYLGVKRWVRLYTPDVLLGVYTVDELQEERELNPIDQPAQRPVSMAERMEARRAQMRSGKDPEVVINPEPESEPEPEFDHSTGEVYDHGIDPIEELKLFIAECTTLQELAKLGKEISEMKELDEKEKAALQAAYKTQSETIRGNSAD